MTEKIWKMRTPRQGFVVEHIPTRRASMYGGSLRAHDPMEYTALLDSLYENALATADANGTWHLIDNIVTGEARALNLRLLPRHEKMVRDALLRYHATP